MPVTSDDGFRDLISEGDVTTILKRYFPSSDFDAGLFTCKEDEHEDLIYELLSHGLDELQAFGDVRHTDSFMSISIKRNPGFKVGVSLESNLLDLEISAQDMDPDELMELLNYTFSDDGKAEEKVEGLKSRFGIDISQELKEDIGTMCNFSEVIEERGIEKGLEQGLEQGEYNANVKTAAKLLAKGTMSIEEISEVTDLTIDQVRRIAEDRAS